MSGRLGRILGIAGGAIVVLLAIVWISGGFERRIQPGTIEPPHGALLKTCPSLRIAAPDCLICSGSVEL